MPLMRIESRENPKVRRVAKLLADRAARRAEAVFVAENPGPVLEALDAGIVPESVFFDETALETNAALAARCEASGTAVFCLPHTLARRVSALETPQGVSAIIPIVQLPRCVLQPGGRYVVLERVADPGNVGTIIRTADAFGFDGVLLSQGCADAFSPKTLRSTMGSIFRTPLMTGISVQQVIADCARHGIVTAAAVLDDAAVPAEQLDASQGIAVFIGNEAAGLTKETAEKTTQRVYLQMTGGAQSLNAAVAASILMWILRR